MILVQVRVVYPSTRCNIRLELVNQLRLPLLPKHPTPHPVTQMRMHTPFEFTWDEQIIRADGMQGLERSESRKIVFRGGGDAAIVVLPSIASQSLVPTCGEP